MRGTSARSFSEVYRIAQPAFADATVNRESLARELFAIADQIDTSNQAVRLMSDPGRPAEVKLSALRILFANRVSARALELASSVIARRWSEQEDILVALERLGVAALFAQADSEGDFGRVEEELFEVSRLISETPELSTAFDDARENPASRGAVLRSLLSDKAHRITVALAERAVSTRSDAKPARRVADFAEFASQQRSRLLVLVQSARELTAQQLSRLTEILKGIYGSEPQINVEVVPGLVGGLRIQVGDDLYDASVLAKLAQARNHLVA